MSYLEMCHYFGGVLIEGSYSMLLARHSHIHTTGEFGHGTCTGHFPSCDAGLVDTTEYPKLNKL